MHNKMYAQSFQRARFRVMHLVAHERYVSKSYLVQQQNASLSAQEKKKRKKTPAQKMTKEHERKHDDIPTAKSSQIVAGKKLKKGQRKKNEASEANSFE